LFSSLTSRYSIKPLCKKSLNVHTPSWKHIWVNILINSFDSLFSR
jgi:hypothetical protein